MLSRRETSREEHRRDFHDRSSSGRHRDSAPSAPPPREGDIFEGEIVRIEPYGAFCSLLGTRWQGLIHISQLYDSRVEQVQDVVSLNDRVWVKVLQVEQQQQQENGGLDLRPRFRIKLSMKDVLQDGSRQDLGRQREQNELVKTQLETNLNSMIGVAVARDPMENQRLLLKSHGNLASKNATTFRGGYTLVGDDEGEPPESENAAINETQDTQLKPMGRGRGTTLPAWMTSVTNNHDGPTGDKIETAGHESDSESDDDNSRYKRKRKRHKKSSRKDEKRHSKKRRKKSRKYYSSDEISGSSSSVSDRHRDERPKKKDSDRSGHERDTHKKKRRHDSKNPRQVRSRSSDNLSPSNNEGGANEGNYGK